MSFIKRIFGSYINSHQSGYRNSHHGGYSKSHHGKKNYYNDFSLSNEYQGVRCSKCQTYNAPDSRFCGQCGQVIQNSTCSCGALIEGGAKFCGQCGKSIG
ncbi:zinc ribbon domain-containing protein [Legionella longbeachae]|uniref:DZANK-type domain-containing protein n=1 Tax=Legionella longbeachae serogroup 1 (strain NSW150) TaxID=661367 RepID=D3HS98_LEGLN|nr:zinc ribbon domain-containing protein [Legionella longbeachae]VEE02281.1 Double zinc ribbon [Legionella oakridgensis]HBD7398229.1 zinc ribbon domain-containing protein [Legionella pneumophila]ARB91426.1 zinc ribbon domain-containing protein [Legionella longbeachae]ARM32148.1 zinc ribbon domain-containing protein [Legionella longbeachae]QEY51366.1 zinc ribbon domain-containing protein [Legionella longbeachae]